MRAVGLALVGALLAGCSDYALKAREAENDATDTSTSFAPDTDTGAPDGVCEEAPALPAGVQVDESCVATPSVGTLDAVMEWSRPMLGDFPDSDHVLMAPAVGPLSDEDGDGDVDADDPPMVVVISDDGGDEARSIGVLRVLDGRDGAPRMSSSVAMYGDYQVFPYRYGNVALGDVDGDGRAEIVTIVTVVGGPPGDPGDEVVDTAEPDEPREDTGIVVRPPPPSPTPSGGPCRVAAYSPDGEVRWLGDEEAGLPCGGHAPALADLDGDGAVEVIVGPVILVGATGELRARTASAGGRPEGFDEAGYMSFAADLDGDGEQEVVAGDGLYTADGSTKCATGYPDGFPAVADLDGDGTGELVVVASGTLRVFDATCGLRSEVDLVGDGFGGPPSVGDLDADGLPEIGVADAEVYAAYEADGAVLWSVAVSDWSSSTTGASFFDFDGDGGLEVVYADETALWILDGTTGAVRLQDDTHSSRTLHELPVVVDVDGDGLTEIVVPNGGTHGDAEATGLYVLGSADGSWATNRRVWNQHAYAIVNVEDDLGVPASPLSSWPTWNTFRSGTVDPVGGGALADAVPLAEVCAEACADGRLFVSVAVGNEGVAGLRSGVPVTVYVDEGLVGTSETTDVVDAGAVSAPLRFEVAAGARVRVVVDQDGSGLGRVLECDETDNVVELEGCP